MLKNFRCMGFVNASVITCSTVNRTIFITNNKLGINMVMMFAVDLTLAYGLDCKVHPIEIPA